MSKAARRRREPIWLKRTPDGFIFAAEIDREMAARWGVGSLVQADIAMPRSGRQNRWYHALLRVVYGHQERIKTFEGFKFVMKIRLGLVEAIKVSDGETHLMPISTSYDSMEQGEFSEVVDKTFEVIAREIIPGMDRKARAEIEREVDALIR